MVFSSAIFLWGFLPLVFIINGILGSRYSNLFLLFASLFFYAWGEPRLIFLMILSILINWTAGRMIGKFPNYKNKILILDLLLNLFILGYFKYAGFLANTINSIAGKKLLAIRQIPLPIGISFFTFQAISYVVDVYRGEAQAKSKLIHTALYISFFPQLIAGPIVRYTDMNRQLEERTITADKAGEGVRRFIYGLSKKVLISNILGRSADMIFSMEISQIDGRMAWAASLFYLFQIYYDFSGYSDMAIGLGRMFGFNFLENFYYPYLSRSIKEFWNRWHISLGVWFKEYVYIPLGGNRKGKQKTYRNLLIVFFLTGLWHGAGFNFILWGLYYGFFSVLERMGGEKILKKHSVAAHIYTLLVVHFGWVLFRIEDIRTALMFLKRMLLPWNYPFTSVSLWECMNGFTLFIFLCAVCGMGLIQTLIPEKIKNIWKCSIGELIYCTVILLLSIASVASGTYNPFIYFKF